MNYIKKITDEDFGINSKAFDNPRHRYGARGIIFNKDGKIAILNKTLKNEYKLIGGGIEKGETPTEAFIREALEESGCVIKIDKLLGIIEEFKSLDNFIQTSYVYVGKVLKDKRKLNLTEKEINEGAKILWLDLNDAMNKIKECEDKLIESKYENVYHTKFIVRRDYEILKYYKNNS